MAKTHRLFELEVSSFASKPTFTGRKVIFWKQGRRTAFYITSFSRGPRRKEVGSNEAPYMSTNCFVFLYLDTVYQEQP